MVQNDFAEKQTPAVTISGLRVFAAFTSLQILQASEKRLPDSYTGSYAASCNPFIWLAKQQNCHLPAEQEQALAGGSALGQELAAAPVPDRALAALAVAPAPDRALAAEALVRWALSLMA